MAAGSPVGYVKAWELSWSELWWGYWLKMAHPCPLQRHLWLQWKPALGSFSGVKTWKSLFSPASSFLPCRMAYKLLVGVRVLLKTALAQIVWKRVHTLPSCNCSSQSTPEQVFLEKRLKTTAWGSAIYYQPLPQQANESWHKRDNNSC